MTPGQLIVTRSKKTHLAKSCRRLPQREISALQVELRWFAHAWLWFFAHAPPPPQVVMTRVPPEHGGVTEPVTVVSAHRKCCDAFASLFLYFI